MTLKPQPSLPDSFYLSFEALAKRLEDYPVYMADAFTVGRNPLTPKTLTSISAKQLPSYAGSAQAAAEDVKLYLKQFDCVAADGLDLGTRPPEEILTEAKAKAAALAETL